MMVRGSYDDGMYIGYKLELQPMVTYDSMQRLPLQ